MMEIERSTPDESLICQPEHGYPQVDRRSHHARISARSIGRRRDVVRRIRHMTVSSDGNLVFHQSSINRIGLVMIGAGN
jgi:hypothetical protein